MASRSRHSNPQLLPQLLARALGAGVDQVAPLPAVPVTGIAQDHRRVKPGDLFVARIGARFDAHDYLDEVIGAGAVAVVGSKRELAGDTTLAVPYLFVPDDRLALARLSASFHGNPSQQLRVAGVTGTDGKTTVSYLLHHLLGGFVSSGLLSTAGVRIGERTLPGEGRFTTPEASEVQALLRDFVDGGCTHAVVETSSHALAMHRVTGTEYDVAVWTNLTPEHLDYHGSFGEYREAKLGLIRAAPVAVLNADDPEYETFRRAAPGRVVSYGLGQEAQVRAIAMEEQQAGLRFEVLWEDERVTVGAPLVGEFNVYNVLAALAAARLLLPEGSGAGLAQLAGRLRDFPGVPGRMQLVQASPFKVIVDFAHTGPALEKVLQVLRPGTPGRIILVVGAAGERDPGKRGPLGRAAARGADLLYFSEEDHRSEPIEEILGQLQQAALEAGAAPEAVHLVADRSDAIAAALAQARAGDTVLLAGKGHEATLERGDRSLPWNEVEEARKHLT